MPLLVQDAMPISEFDPNNSEGILRMWCTKVGVPFQDCNGSPSHHNCPLRMLLHGSTSYEGAKGVDAGVEHFLGEMFACTSLLSEPSIELILVFPKDPKCRQLSSWRSR